MHYELRELDSNQIEVIHELDFENIADIQVCLEIVRELKKTRTPDGKGGLICDCKRMEDIVRGLPNIECLPETIRKMSKVTVPVTDY